MHPFIMACTLPNICLLWAHDNITSMLGHCGPDIQTLCWISMCCNTG